MNVTLSSSEAMDTITTTIKRHWLDEIISRRKRIEHRDIKRYWELKLAAVTAPFRLRLINGMSATAPEVTVKIIKVVRNTRGGTFNLHIGRVLEVRNWRRPMAITSGQKAAATRKRRAAGRKAALTRKRRAAGKKAAATRKRRAAGKKAPATRKDRTPQR
jgi:hypothetical protein